MVVAGIAMKKIELEKLGPAKGKVSINNNALITEIESANLAAGSVKRPAVRVSFEYTSLYEPKVAAIRLKGSALWLDLPEKVKELLEGWKKDRKVPKEVSAAVLNAIFARCSTTAILLSREMNLPPPIQLPRVKAE
jgi:hypothetical protein